MESQKKGFAEKEEKNLLEKKKPRINHSITRRCLSNTKAYKGGAWVRPEKRRLNKGEPTSSLEECKW